ncbi:hypothetical protein TRFO_19592 [Tritrichomonas foetus]|uniref:Uncharacterized protein n=1 Tax=Tritrichomonas foetus TaxID=1144522 RepID=A0A1J4KM89_9EUKA|nr:hypothetical protein TRFO_19592 [Tritrichomonas foetus]|eukprot:OHT10916.1 hypothetical protein TRFO_19592 [Tritrichomonas foetus]
MDIFAQYEKNLQAVRARANTMGSTGNVTNADKEYIIKEGANLDKMVIDMAKQCLINMSNVNEMLDMMANNINIIDGEMNTIKNKKAEQVNLHSKKLNSGLISAALLVESAPSKTIYLPTNTFNISMECLSDIGPKIEDPKSKCELIRKINPNTIEPQIWCRESDYFVIKGDRNMSTFNEVYKTPVRPYTPGVH